MLRLVAKLALAAAVTMAGESIGKDRYAAGRERMAAQIVQNREVYDTGNREMNPYAGNMQLIVSPGAWLDSTAWFLLDGSQSTKPLGLLVRKEPTLVTWDVEEDSAGGTRYLKWHARLKIFYGNWRYAAMGNT